MKKILKMIYQLMRKQVYFKVMEINKLIRIHHFYKMKQIIFKKLKN